MSEPIGVCIEIGGTLPASLMDKFLEAVLYDLDNLDGPTTREELIELSGTENIRYDGTAAYGLCKNLYKFCQEHRLQYTQYSGAKNEYDACTTYWKPGMKEAESFKTDVNNQAMLRASDVSPLVHLLRDLIIEGETALPRYINEKNKRVNELVKAGLNAKNGITHASRFVRRLDMLIRDLLPRDIDNVPVIIIDLNK